MAISISEDDVRSALDGTIEEFPDSDLSFEIRQAEALVNDELLPSAGSNQTNRLELVGALLAAAYVEDARTVSQLSQGNRSISFNNEESLSLFEQAKQMDPTDRLEALDKPSAGIHVPDAKGIDDPHSEGR